MATVGVKGLIISQCLVTVKSWCGVVAITKCIVINVL